MSWVRAADMARSQLDTIKRADMEQVAGALVRVFNWLGNAPHTIPIPFRHVQFGV